MLWEHKWTEIRKLYCYLEVRYFTFGLRGSLSSLDNPALHSFVGGRLKVIRLFDQFDEKKQQQTNNINIRK